MSFWNTSSGDNAAENASTEYDVGGGFEIIPDKSMVICEVDQAGWAQDDSFNNFISLRWSVVKPEALAGTKIFHKLWVEDPDPRAKDADKKRDKALNMLAAIDANCGGKLARKGTRPTDDDLALALVGKPMGTFVRVWEMGGNEGNWIAAVKPMKATEVKVAEAAAPKSGGGARSGSIAADIGDSEIPF